MPLTGIPAIHPATAFTYAFPGILFLQLVQPLRITYASPSPVLSKQRRPKENFLSGVFVVQEGLEPSQAEPESEVLPLHHWTNLRFSFAKVRNYFFPTHIFALKNASINFFLHYRRVRAIPTESHRTTPASRYRGYVPLPHRERSVYVSSA